MQQTVKLLNVLSGNPSTLLTTEIYGEETIVRSIWKFTRTTTRPTLLILEWHKHLVTGMRAYVSFPNGWAMSIIKGEMYYCNNIPIGKKNSTFEVGIMYDNELQYNTPIPGYDTQDVLGHLSYDDIMNIALVISKF